MARSVTLAGCLVAMLTASSAASADSRPGFGAADKNGDGKLTEGEAMAAGLLNLMENWQEMDLDSNGSLSRREYLSWMAGSGDEPAPGADAERKKSAAASRQPPPARAAKRKADKAIGRGSFKAPETALWDEQADVYLVSNVNGGLAALDGNGFISRVSPDGTIVDVKWIDASQPGVTLHGPKGMIFVGEHLVVADVNGVRYFDRSTGKPVRSIPVPGAHMLNDVAVDEGTGTLYVTDTGTTTGNPPGAVYRIAAGEDPVAIAEGHHLDRPDGVLWHEGGLLITPFGAHAKEVYTLTTKGDRRSFARVPAAQLDGLLRFPDGSFAVTSWKGQSIYRLSSSGGQATAIVTGVRSPAQLGYDEKRQRLLVPVLEEDELRFYGYAGPARGRGQGDGG